MSPGPATACWARMLPLRLPLITCCLLAATAFAAEEPAPAAPPPERPVEALAWEVFTAFSASCADCHGGHRSRPKGGFGHVMDLARLGQDETYVTPGKPLESELYKVLIDPDPDFLMPPPDSDFPPLSPAQIQAVHDWIAAGAGIAAASAAPVAADPAAVAVVVVEPAPEAEPGGFSLTRTFGLLHPLVVHLPIALLLAAAGAAIADRIRPRPWLDGAMAWCLWWGALGALGSVATGWVDADVQGYADPTVFLHRWLGVATAGAALLAAVLDAVGRLRQLPRLRTLGFVLLLIAVLLVSITGHNGGELVHGEDYLW